MVNIFVISMFLNKCVGFIQLKLKKLLCLDIINKLYPVYEVSNDRDYDILKCESMRKNMADTLSLEKSLMYKISNLYY